MAVGINLGGRLEVFVRGTPGNRKAEEVHEELSDRNVLRQRPRHLRLLRGPAPEDDRGDGYSCVMRLREVQGDKWESGAGPGALVPGAVGSSRCSGA